MSVTDTLLAVTVTSKPSVTVMYTVGGTVPEYVTDPVHVGVSVVLFKKMAVLELVHEPVPMIGNEGGARDVLVVVVEEFESAVELV